MTSGETCASHRRANSRPLFRARADSSQLCVAGTCPGSLESRRRPTSRSERAARVPPLAPPSPSLRFGICALLRAPAFRSPGCGLDRTPDPEAPLRLLAARDVFPWLLRELRAPRTGARNATKLSERRFPKRLVHSPNSLEALPFRRRRLRFSCTFFVSGAFNGRCKSNRLNRLALHRTWSFPCCRWKRNRRGAEWKTKRKTKRQRPTT